MISGPLPSTDVVQSRPKPWWDRLFAEQDERPVVDNSWGNRDEIITTFIGWIGYGVAFVALFALMRWLSPTITAVIDSIWPH